MPINEDSTSGQRIENETAIIWEGDEPGDVNHITYHELKNEVCKIANALKSKGVAKGDVVTLYMPMVPELCYTMLACARIGAIHSVIFAGFSADAIADRIQDAKSKWVVTASAGSRGGRNLPLKSICDAAVKKDRCVGVVEKVFVFDGKGDTGSEWEVQDIHVKMTGRCGVDFERLSNSLTFECRNPQLPQNLLRPSVQYAHVNGWMRRTHSSFFTRLVRPVGQRVLYTQLGGTHFSLVSVFDYASLSCFCTDTHNRKLSVHTTANSFGLSQQTSASTEGPKDVYACVADAGWITGHTYIVYG